jgi:hypothetical protein
MCHQQSRLSASIKNVTDRFVPFDATDDEVSVLLDGVPPWASGSFIRWILDAFPTSYTLQGPYNNRRYFYPGDTIREMERATSRSLGIGTSAQMTPADFRKALTGAKESTLLRVADFWLATHASGLGDAHAISLEAILHQCRSKWAVREVSGVVRLSGRVAEGVQDVAENLITTAGTAGRHLRDSWEAIHALAPDPPKAYASAIKAVESAARPKVLPQNLQATLGTIKTQMFRDGNWRLPLVASPEHATPNLPLEMTRALWEGQTGRHGEDEYKDVSYAQARAAVMLAVTLVDLYSEDIIERDALA